MIKKTLALLQSFLAISAFAIAVTSCANRQASSVKQKGAVETGQYHNLFTEVCGIPEEAVQQRLDSLWVHFFTPGNFDNYDGPNETSVYYQVGDSMAFVYDVGSGDVRTEGMSYGMMISLQYGQRDAFDRLWRWSKQFMAFRDKERKGYFCWQCRADGTQFGTSNASDGEIYYATALLMAANRWNEPEYAREACELLVDFQEKDTTTGNYPLYDINTKLPCFVPNNEVHWFSDPSYCLPAFLEIWKERATSNNEFWAQAAEANRDLLAAASHPVTGLFPDYSLMNGEPYNWPRAAYNTGRYMYDAIRCPMNVGMDSHWWGKDTERQREMMRRLLTFFQKDGYQHGIFDLDGNNAENTPTAGAIGANAVGAFALLGSEDPSDKELLRQTVQRFWNQEIPSGHWRYYNGMVYMLSMLHVSGQFRVY